MKNRTFNYQKKINLSQLSIHQKEKLSYEKIKQKIAELNRNIKNYRNNYNTNFNNKTKRSLIKNSLQHTLNCNNTNTNNNCLGKKKLCLSNSFLIRAKSKAPEKNSNKKFLIFKK